MAFDLSWDQLDWYLFTINNTSKQIHELYSYDGSKGENYKQRGEDIVIVMYWISQISELIRINKISAIFYWFAI